VAEYSNGISHLNVERIVFTILEILWTSLADTNSKQ
jgi:hypothetical protein